jgi:hypothetical protein
MTLANRGLVVAIQMFTPSSLHDNMKSQVVSLRGNKCCEIYATNFGWSRAFPLQKESDVHETLDLFLGRYGIPEALVSHNAKAYIHGDSNKKAKEAGVF